MALDRKQLVSRRHEVKPFVDVELPSGGSVRMRVPTGKDYSDWQAYLRDEKGKLIEDREDLSSEFLIATVLVNPDGSQMFSAVDVLDKAMDELLHADFNAMLSAAHKLFGISPGFIEDIEKNLSTTPPSVR